jgi:hypothetical protein
MRRYCSGMKSGFSLLSLASAALLLGGCVLLPPTVSTPPIAPADTRCADVLARKVVVTAFPLRHPEQIRTGEYMGWPQVTAEMLARELERGGTLRALAAPQRFPFAMPESAPEVEQKAGQPVIVDWAAHAGAQYVIAGVFHDFGVVKNEFLVPERHLIVEAFIYDGVTGNLQARREFAWKLPLQWEMPRSMSPGTREFAASRLGQLYLALLEDMGRWAENTIACQPFPLRVAKVDGRRLHFSFGSDRGISPGMTLQNWRPGGPAPARRAGELSLGGGAFASFREVSPQASVAEIPLQRNQPTARVGDVLYISPAALRNNP